MEGGGNSYTTALDIKHKKGNGGYKTGGKDVIKGTNNPTVGMGVTGETNAGGNNMSGNVGGDNDLELLNMDLRLVEVHIEGNNKEK